MADHCKTGEQRARDAIRTTRNKLLIFYPFIAACFLCNLHFTIFDSRDTRVPRVCIVKVAIFLCHTLFTLILMLSIRLCNTLAALNCAQVAIGLSTLVALSSLPLPSLEADLTLIEVGV